MNRDDIGELFFVGFEGTSLSDTLQRFLLDLKPAGVILFARNIEGPAQVAALNRDLQLLAMDNWTSGLLIGVDQEGGRVRRLRAPFVSCPSAQTLSRDPRADEIVRSYMTITAYELKLVGFNTNFVPVLDVLSGHSDTATSVIGDRSFGDNPVVAARLGQIVIQSLRSTGVIPCGKHYPGHGGTQVDSHVELPVDERDEKSIREKDFVPFEMAIEHGVDMLMTAHVVYPALDSSLPATLSPKIVNDILRSDLGYDGVVITDDLDMGAIANHYNPAQCAELALNAGADLLLFSKSKDEVLAARDAIVERMEEGRISLERIAHALQRTQALKERYAPHLRPADPDATRRHFDV